VSFVVDILALTGRNNRRMTKINYSSLFTRYLTKLLALDALKVKSVTGLSRVSEKSAAAGASSSVT